MSESFDPYHEWLGISPKDQPPTHYRLLGVELFESKASVIENAADRQMAAIRTRQTGKFGAESQRLLNEISAARICLLNADRKAAYDASLNAASPAASPPPVAVAQAAPPGPPVQPPAASFAPPAAVSAPPKAPAPAAKPRGPKAPAGSRSVQAPAAGAVVSKTAAPRHHARRKTPSWLLPVAGLGVAMAFCLVMVGLYVLVDKERSRAKVSPAPTPATRPRRRAAAEKPAAPVVEVVAQPGGDLPAVGPPAVVPPASRPVGALPPLEPMVLETPAVPNSDGGTATTTAAPSATLPSNFAKTSLTDDPGDNVSFTPKTPAKDGSAKDGTQSD